MGVHGLWRLLDSFGVVVQPDALKGKRVAIDASIWIAQFRARVAPGEDIEHKVLEGFLARILKLLFYEIRPVFVFDGTSSSSKGAEHDRRAKQRARNAQALLKRRARQILMAQVAAGTVRLGHLKAVTPSDAQTEGSAAGAEKVSDAPATSTAASSAKGPIVSQMALDGDGAGRALGATTSTRSSVVHIGKRPRQAGEKALSPSGPHRRRRCRRKFRLSPEAVSATMTQRFLSDAEGFLEERKRNEARVLQNALQNTSTSLFMGPRLAVDEDAVDAAGAITSEHRRSLYPSCTAPVILVSGDEQEGDETDCVIVSGGESDAEAVSSTCCTVSSTDTEEGSCVEEVVLTDKAGGFDHMDAAEVEFWFPPSARSPSTPTAVLESGDMTRFLNGLSPSMRTPPPKPVSTVAVSERAPSSTASSTSTALTASADEDTACDLGSVSSRSGTPDFPRSGSSEREATFTEVVDADDSDSVKFLWEPFTQRLHLVQLLRHTQENECNPHSPRSSVAHLIPALSVVPSPADAATAGEKDDGDYTPVKAGQVFPQCRAAPAPLPTLGSISGDGGKDEKDHFSTPPAEPSPNTVKAALSEAARETCYRRAEVHSVSSNRICTMDGAPPRNGGAVRVSRVVVPFELINVVELLDCCGVPFVLSPAEADAQCAFLARQGLVDAVFTEDSDVLVHGATTVLRGFFAQSKNVVAYEQAHLSACGITKTVLVALASLLGCDYTEGVSGIGLVSALEALVVAWTTAQGAESGASSSSAVLHLLRRWALLVQQPPNTWQEVDDDMSILQFALLQADLAQWRTLEKRACFPEAHAVEAFFDAAVDSDTTPFEWLPPDWERIRLFAGALGALSSPWLVQRYELARTECLRREAAATKARASTIAGQRRLTEYGVRERVRATWAYQKQPPKHASVLAKLRSVQQMQ
ncbi:hypothetical protein CUR178_01135 [Leishmania enriettii]|uniref:DNA repair protein RAD2 n=1 Tax=Leishmania enriettii TaxID=5663 RepID=A0A836G3X9_LEIEN|nr:hypothetical protein CUR178_01135 [Leishmania enriettii]